MTEEVQPTITRVTEEMQRAYVEWDAPELTPTAHPAKLIGFARTAFYAGWNARANQPPAQDGLDALAQNKDWELSFGPVDEEEGTSWAWRVYAVNGGRNEREWTLLGTGDTPQEAIDAALASLGDKP